MIIFYCEYYVKLEIKTISTQAYYRENENLGLDDNSTQFPIPYNPPKTIKFVEITRLVAPPPHPTTFFSDFLY